MTLLAGCGGSNTNNIGVLQAPLISGTVAAATGPITGAMGGTVTLKDSTGPARTVTTTLDSQGHYSFTLNQVQGFAAPFMLEASYQVGGVTYTLHSSVTTQDYASGNVIVDINPLTELVVGNIVDSSPQGQFANGGFSSYLTQAAMQNGVQALTPLLQNLMNQFGINANSAQADFLHQSFTANGTGIDAVINAVYINIDQIGKNEVITNALTGDTISGTLSGPPTTVLANTAIANGGSLADLQAITKQLNALSATYATYPSASSSSLLGYFDQTNFLHGGASLSSYLSSLIGNTNAQIANSGFAYTDIVLSPVPAYVSLPAGATTSYLVSYTALQNSAPQGRESVVMYKNSAGQWLILGNQQKAKVNVTSFAGQINSNPPCTGLKLQVEDAGRFTDGSGNPVPVAYALVSGPGLSPSVMLYQAGGTQGTINGNSNALTLAAGSSSTDTNGNTVYTYTYNGTATTPAATTCYPNVYTMTDTQIGTINTSSLPLIYTVTLYGAANQTLATYNVPVMAQPLNSSLNVTGLFPTGITSSVGVQSFITAGSSTTIDWTDPAFVNTPTFTLGLIPNELVLWSTATGSTGTPNTTISRFGIPAGLAEVSITPQANPTATTGNFAISYIDTAFRKYWSSAAGF